MKEDKEFKMPFLTNSKIMMVEFIRKSKRVSALDEFLNEFGTFEIQRLFMKVFNKNEQEFLEKNWRDLGLREMLATKSDTEALPEDWFRKV
jgi:hypothetical protein